jgi:serine/threonine protein kinase
MNFANGGTLLQQIQSQARKDPYSERRIAFYALQLSEALAFAHERNVFHHDVKSANVLIDAREAGKLLLADFGTSVAAGEAAVGFTLNYASPELLSAHRHEEYEGLQAEKIDAFGLGCIIFELLTCQSLADLSGGQHQTLGDYISEGPGLEAALNLPYVRLPWLSENHQSCNGVGYSHALGSLIKTLLEPNPENRWPPSALQKPFRNDPRSPLISPNVLAAQAPIPGAPVTIDNVQFGMFVQRGVHWNDGDDDGGPGSIGVVVKLDDDAGYTSVAFPSRTPGKDVETLCCRIGANNKSELQVGPRPLPDFYGNTNEEHMPNGVLTSTDLSKYHVGQLINENCMVVGIIQEHSSMLVAPMERIQITSIDPPPTNALGISFAAPREPRRPPESWKDSEGILLEVNDPEEREDILELFYATNGGMDANRYEVTSLKRVQSTIQWDAYARTREAIATDNWGVTNEKRLFHGTLSGMSVGTLLSQCADFYQAFFRSNGGTKSFERMHFAKKAARAHLDNSWSRSGEMKTVLARVTLGRVLNQDESPSTFLNYHSKIFESAEFRCQTTSQVFPEYIITYKDSSRERSAALRRRVVRAARPGKRGGHTATPGHLASLSLMAIGSQAGNYFAAVATAQHKIADSGFNLSSVSNQGGGPSSSKLCVVCLERPVCRILLPCGHPCLCMECSTTQGISKLSKRCPECRTEIKRVSNIYGRVVND